MGWTVRGGFRRRAQGRCSGPRCCGWLSHEHNSVGERNEHRETNCVGGMKVAVGQSVGVGAMGPRGRGPAGPWRQAPLGPRLSSFSVSEGRLRITAGNYRRCSQIPIKNAEEPSLSPGRPGRSRCSGGRGALVARTDGPPRGAVLPGSSPLLNDFLGEKVICPVGGNDSAKKRAIISAQGHCTWKPAT